MRKPNNFENVQAQGEFTPVELGGHKLIIKQVEERMSKTNKPMIVVFFDFAPGDNQARYFAEKKRMRYTFAAFVEKISTQMRRKNM